MAGRLDVDSVSRIPTCHNLSLNMMKTSTYSQRKVYNPFSEFFIESSSSFHKLRWNSLQPGQTSFHTQRRVRSPTLFFSLQDQGSISF